MNAKNGSRKLHLKWTLLIARIAGVCLYLFLIDLFRVIRKLELVRNMYYHWSWPLCDVAILIVAIVCLLFFCVGLLCKNAKFLQIAQWLCLLLLVLVVFTLCLVMLISSPVFWTLPKN